MPSKKETANKAEQPEFVKHAKAAGKATLNQWKSLIPKEFWQHGREARRETLLALRSLIDDAIERLEKAENPKPSQRKVAKAEAE